MKINFITIAFFTGLMILVATGCKEPMQKKIAGIWYIEDVSLSGDTSLLSSEQFKNAIEDQKRLRFEMREDSSISIYTGSAEIDGKWWYVKNNKQVFVNLEGNIEPTLLGIYQEGKLINNDTTSMGAIIRTVFVKAPAEDK